MTKHYIIALSNYASELRSTGITDFSISVEHDLARTSSVKMLCKIINNFYCLKYNFFFTAILVDILELSLFMDKEPVLEVV